MGNPDTWWSSIRSGQADSSRMESREFPLPTAQPHQWVVYLTARCNFACDYCIQKGQIVPGQKRRPWSRYDELAGKEWVAAFNAMPTRPEHTLILTGGEPTIHRDFYYIATHLDGYKLDLTSNLSFDIDEFIGAMRSAGRTFYSSFHTYHPNWMKPDVFVEKAAKLRDAGVIESPVFSLVNLDEFPHFRDAEHNERTAEFQDIANRLGLRFQRNEFRGNHMGAPFTHDQKYSIDCTSGWVNFAPNGDVYNCQYHLEQGIDCFGNVTRIDECRHFPRFGEFFPCTDFGFCDSCHENSGRGAFRDSEGNIFRRTDHDARVYLQWMDPDKVADVARRFMMEGNVEEAKHAFLAAIGKDKASGGEGSAETWADLGLTLWEGGEKDRALAALMHALELGNEDLEVAAAVVELGRETDRRDYVTVELERFMPRERIVAIERAVEASFV